MGFAFDSQAKYKESGVFTGCSSLTILCWSILFSHIFCLPLSVHLHATFLWLALPVVVHSFVPSEICFYQTFSYVYQWPWFWSLDDYTAVLSSFIEVELVTLLIVLLHYIISRFPFSVSFFYVVNIEPRKRALHVLGEKLGSSQLPALVGGYHTIQKLN